MPIFVWDYNYPARPWNELVGPYTQSDGPPTEAGICLLHREQLAPAIATAWNEASAACIGIAIRGPGYLLVDQRHNRPNLYFRRAGVSSSTDGDASFRRCFARFRQDFEQTGSPRFDLLEPDGIPEVLLAWVLKEKAGQSGVVPPEIDQTALREAYNQLWDRTPAARRDNVDRLDQVAEPNLDRAVELIRANRANA